MSTAAEFARPSAGAPRAPWRALPLALALLALVAGCGGDEPRLEPRRLDARATLEVAGRPVEVELARTEDEIRLGLMYRKQLPDDQGMLFLFRGDGPRSFFMRNTLIPLDICFLDATGRVINIVSAEPLVEEPRAESAEPARYVLELAGGWAERHGLEPGDRVEIGDDVVREAQRSERF